MVKGDILAQWVALLPPPPAPHHPSLHVLLYTHTLSFLCTASSICSKSIQVCVYKLSTLCAYVCLATCWRPAHCDPCITLCDT